MTEREALKLALEALERCGSENYTIEREAIAAIKEALAQQCVCGEPNSAGTHRTDGPCLAPQPEQEQSGFFSREANTPLYSTPPQRKPLTDEEIILIVAECAASHQHTDIHFARAIERAHGIKELV